MSLFVVDDMTRAWDESHAKVKTRAPLRKRELGIMWRMYLLSLNVGDSRMLTMDEYNKVGSFLYNRRPGKKRTFADQGFKIPQPDGLPASLKYPK